MRHRMRLFAVLLGVVGAMLVSAAPSVAQTCTPDPADCSGWYSGSVTVSWANISPDCPPVTIASDTLATGTDLVCTVGDATQTVTIHFDGTAPAITATPDRPPDQAGWYTAPVTVSFAGSDALSGLASCSPNATYAGPDSASASVVGTCSDNAGNTASKAFALKFDATPPPLIGLAATAGDRRVAVRWSTSADASAVEVVRVPGAGDQPASVVFRGPGSSFVDTAVDNGVRYVYRVRLVDAAGNASAGAVAATPKGPAPDAPPGAAQPPAGPPPEPAPSATRLLFPKANARISATRPPLLRWTRVKRARYYNVQLYRGGRKVLSAWPDRARFQLKRRWAYAGRRQRLRPGRYVWYVWPGYGRRSRGRYGALLGRLAFRVVR